MNRKFLFARTTAMPISLFLALKAVNLLPHPAARAPTPPMQRERAPIQPRPHGSLVPV
jgi:hypothetical protein